MFSLGHVRSLWHEFVRAAVGSRRLPSCLPDFQLWMLYTYKGQLHLELNVVIFKIMSFRRLCSSSNIIDLNRTISGMH